MPCRLLVLMLSCCLWSLLAGAETPRLELNQDALEDLPQEERLAFIDAQKPLRAENWKSAALGFHGFCAAYPESILWVHAAWLEAFARLRCGQNNTAIERLAEIVQVSPQAPEIPEVLLLAGESWMSLGDLARAQQLFRDLVDKHPATSAALVARVHLDDCIVNLGKQQGTGTEQIETARLGVLAALPTISAGSHDGPYLRQGLERLLTLHAAHGRFNDMLLALSAVLIANPRDLPDFNPPNFVAEQRRRVCTLTLEAGDDALFSQVANESWPIASERATQVATLRCDFFQDLVMHVPAREALARRRKTTATALLTSARDGLATVGEESLAVALTMPSGRPREELAWLAVRALQLTGRTDAPSRSLKALSEGLGRDLQADAARQYVAWGLAAGLPAAAVHGVVDLVAEGQPRNLALFAVLYEEADGHQPAALRTSAAEQAVALAEHLAADLPERQAEFLSIEGRLLEDPLRDFAAAIVTYTKLDQPPGTDFAIVRCLEGMGKHKDAFQRLGTIYATNATNDNGATALLRQGFMAHQQLQDRARAVALLRQVCDEFPNSPQYSEAHVYLQSHLDVTYTGGGGQRNK